MANKTLTPYQKGVVKRYYENKEGIACQKLGEIVSDLYFASGPSAKQLWASAEAALGNMGVEKKRFEKIVADRDLEELAKLVGELF